MLTTTPSGLYCPAADVFIDPHKPVHKALITHAHADHARNNHQHYLAAQGNEHILKLRLSPNINLQTHPYGQTININGVNISFHPAGHIPGSAQIRLEHKGEIWVVSGDYKLNNDGISTPFEPVKCHHFITESTFGLPVFNWKPQNEVFQEIRNYFHEIQQDLIITAYSLGKAQRLLTNLADLPLYIHKTILDTTNALALDHHGPFPTNLQHIPQTKSLSLSVPKSHSPSVYIIPPAALNSKLSPLNSPLSTLNSKLATCSGWMSLRGARRWGNYDRGFVLSDHADFHELETACLATGAHSISVTHGYSAAFARYLSEKHGLQTQTLKSAWEREE